MGTKILREGASPEGEGERHERKGGGVVRQTPFDYRHTRQHTKKSPDDSKFNETPSLMILSDECVCISSSVILYFMRGNKDWLRYFCPWG